MAAYRQMLLIRRFEERAGQLYAMGQINGFCHLSIGREAVITGMAMAASQIDQVITTHRCHGHAITQGCEPQRLMAELLGRASGTNGGKGGSLHVTSPQHNFFGGHGIVGAPASLGAGLAFANRYRQNGAVTICTLGKGAADQGQVYEALNLAAQWNLPLVYVIDNDSGESPNVETPLADRGLSFAVKGWWVDGVNVAAVRAAGRTAIDMARDGGGPVILEMRTYPYRGHFNPDAGNAGERQRSLEEIDPVVNLKGRLLREGWTSEDDLKTIDRETRAIVRDAVAHAQNAAAPVAADLKRNVTAPAA